MHKHSKHRITFVVNGITGCSNACLNVSMRKT